MLSIRRWVVAVACLGALVGVACGSEADPTGDGASASSVEVTAADFAFTPTEISVEPGAEVDLTFTNDDDTQHSFTADDLGVELVVDGGDSQSTTFAAPASGSIEFHCKFHQTMTGTITTGDDAGSGGTEESGETTGDDLDY